MCLITATGMLPTATRMDAIVPAVSSGLIAKHPLPVARKVVRGTGVSAVLKGPSP